MFPMTGSTLEVNATTAGQSAPEVVTTLAVTKMTDTTLVGVTRPQTSVETATIISTEAESTLGFSTSGSTEAESTTEPSTSGSTGAESTPTGGSTNEPDSTSLPSPIATMETQTTVLPSTQSTATALPTTEPPCESPSDTCDGHYTCDNATGIKICEDGWEGTECKDRLFTGPGPFDPECPRLGGTCKNGGTCFNGSCCCPVGYEGDICHIDINECADPANCLNGAFCLEGDGPGMFTCFCAQGKWYTKAWLGGRGQVGI